METPVRRSGADGRHRGRAAKVIGGAVVVHGGKATLPGDLRLDRRQKDALLVVEALLGGVGERALAAGGIKLEVAHGGTGERLSLAAPVVGEDHAAARGSGHWRGPSGGLLDGGAGVDVHLGEAEHEAIAGADRAADAHLLDSTAVLDGDGDGEFLVHVSSIGQRLAWSGPIRLRRARACRTAVTPRR